MSSTLTSTAMVGRGAELTALGSLVRGARRGGGLAVVEGEAGIGKTRLVEAALATARDEKLGLLDCRAEELDAYRPFGPIVDCLLAAPQRHWKERVEEALRTEEPAPGMGQGREFRAAELLLELLEEMCDSAPVVFTIEDLHWADPATLAALAFVARGIAKLPAVMVASARPLPRRAELDGLLGLLDSRGALRIELGPLNDEESVALVTELVGAHPGPRLLEQARGAAGNPLFVSELVAALEADGALERTGGAAELSAADATPPLPMTILHRLSFLPREELDLMGLAALLGSSFRASDLALLARRPVVELRPALQAAQRAGVLVERDGRLSFRHELIRDALYEDMPVSLRRGLHAELAKTLAAAGEPSERVADHLLRSAEPGDERAVAALVDAARELVGRGPAAAADLYRHAIEISATPEATRAAVLPELAEALVAAGLLGEGADACDQALAASVNPYWQMRLRHYRVLTLVRGGKIRESVTEAEAALALPGAEGPARDQIRAWLSHARLYQGDTDGAVRDAQALLADDPGGLPEVLALDVVALASYTDGHFARAADEIAGAWERVEASGAREGYEAVPHVVYGKALSRIDRLDEGYAVFQSGRRACESLGMIDVLPTCQFCLAVVDYECGRLDDALAELATQFELTEYTHSGWKLTADSLYALIMLHRGDLLAAEEHVSSAERAAAAGGTNFAIEWMVLARALLLEATGQAAAALDTLTASARQVEQLRCELTRIAVAAGQPERAAHVPEALRRVADQNPGAPSLEAYALRSKALLDQDPDGLLRATELLGKAGRPLEQARAAEDAATLFVPQGSAAAARARELLEEARRTYEAAGATRDVARVDASLRGLGARKGVRSPRRRPQSGWEALTDTELKVVRLVAERLTNPEIAERLFISRRTVQTHVSHALAKVGVSSRRELAAEAARRAGWRIRLEGDGKDAQEAEPALEPLGGFPVDGDGA